MTPAHKLHLQLHHSLIQQILQQRHIIELRCSKHLTHQLGSTLLLAVQTHHLSQNPDAVLPAMKHRHCKHQFTDLLLGHHLQLGSSMLLRGQFAQQTGQQCCSRQFFRRQIGCIKI